MSDCSELMPDEVMTGKSEKHSPESPMAIIGEYLGRPVSQEAQDAIFSKQSSNTEGAIRPVVKIVDMKSSKKHRVQKGLLVGIEGRF